MPKLFEIDSATLNTHFIMFYILQCWFPWQPVSLVLNNVNRKIFIKNRWHFWEFWMSDERGGGQRVDLQKVGAQTKCAGVSPSSYTKLLEMLSTNLNIIRIHHNDLAQALATIRNEGYFIVIATSWDKNILAWCHPQFKHRKGTSICTMLDESSTT